jgi:hypothetical protein
VHTQQRREIAAIDEVLSVSNAELQRHFHVFASMLDENFSLPPGYLSQDWEGGRSARMIGGDDGSQEEDGREESEREEVEEGQEWGVMLRAHLGWGVQQFRDDLKLAKKHFALHSLAQRARRVDPTPFKAWYLTEWHGQRLCPSRQAAFRFAELIVRVSWQSTHARNAALRVITGEFSGAPLEVRSLAALSLSQVQVAGEEWEDGEGEDNTVLTLIEKLGNAAQYGASAEDYMEGKTQVKPSAHIAQAEYIVSPMNCWIDGVLVVKAGEKGQEDKWKMERSTLAHEPTAYAEFAARHPEVATCHEELMIARHAIVQEHWDLNKILALEICVLWLQGMIEYRAVLHQGKQVLKKNLLPQEREELPPDLLQFVQLAQDESETDEDEPPDERVKRRQRKPSPKWLASRQTRAEKGGKSPVELAWSFADLVLRKMLAALIPETNRIYQHKSEVLGIAKGRDGGGGGTKGITPLLGRGGSTKHRAQTHDSSSSKGIAAEIDACMERVRMLIDLVQTRLRLCRERVAEARKKLRAARNAALKRMSRELDMLCEDNPPFDNPYVSTCWNTNLGGLPFEWGARQVRWSAKVETGVYRGGEEMCAAVTRALHNVRGLPAPKGKDGKKRPWRLYASFLGNKGRSADIEIRVDRNLDAVEERRQTSLMKMGVATRAHLKCYFRLLFSSGPHARVSLAPLLNFTKQDTGWGESQRSNNVFAASLSHALPKIEFVGGSGLRFFKYRSKGEGAKRSTALSSGEDDGGSSGSDAESREEEEESLPTKPLRFLGF